MDGPSEDDVVLLADEKFDFDLSLSSSSANEDDEVFFGPVGHKERCVAASLELNHPVREEPLLPASDGRAAWSPLTGEKFVEVYTEARLLALQIETSSRARAARPEAPSGQGAEHFLQEAQSKISLFERENWAKKSPQSLKRETYCLPDAPLRGPPPSRPTGLATTQGPPQLSQPLLPGPKTARPPDQAGPQKKAASKLLPPRASGARGGPLGLAAGKRMKPSQPTREMPASASRGKKIPGEKEPQGDVPSAPSSIVGDITGLPAGDSHVAPGKRSLPVPHKLGLRRMLLRAPGGAGSLARRPSSLGSAPRAGAALAPGPAKPGGRPGVPADSPPPPSDPGGPGSGTPVPARLSVPVDPTGVPGRQSTGAGAAESVPTTAGAALPWTPAHGGPGPRARPRLSQSSQLSGTGGARRRGSSLCPKMEGAPTPTNPFKIPKFSTGEPPDGATPQPLWAQRPQSCTSVGRPALHSTPTRCLSTPAAQSCSRGARTPASTRRLSALPTPAGRRLSSLPLATSRTMPRALASPLCVSSRRLSPEPQEKPSVRAAPSEESGDQAAPGCPDTSPNSSFSPPSTVPQALNFSPEKNDFPFSPSVPTQVALDETRPLSGTSPREAILVDIRLDELTITPKVESTPLIDLPLIDLPLIDFGNTPEAKAALGLESRPLIDLLVNTPDLSRGAMSKPIHEVAQLIDLTSPLIQLSPEADKENVDSPLLKF